MKFLSSHRSLELRWKIEIIAHMLFLLKELSRVRAYRLEMIVWINNSS